MKHIGNRGAVDVHGEPTWIEDRDEGEWTDAPISHEKMPLRNVNEKSVRDYLAKIGAKGGAVSSPAKSAAAKKTWADRKRGKK